MTVLSRSLFLLPVFLCLFLTACRTELYQGLTERSANELLGALLERGLEAEKINQGKNGFAVAVDEADRLRALEILRDLGLPKPSYEGLGVVFRKEGMMSSPLEEKARLSYALSQELAASCVRLDGVVDARAHVVLKDKDVLTGAVTPASAVVMLRYAPDAPVDRYVPQVRSMVVQAVPDVEPDRVSVLTFPVMGEITRPAVLPSTGRVFSPLWGGLGFLAGLPAGGGLLWGFMRLRRSRPGVEGGAS
ncbi:MAG: type III secretion inner membrane ring lipoprotein SctJ [Deltaproteobacteria bacterium]|jgi:type III secretion protein J|nr:type III secretion inner membrane ring lipoprotein SctJ [Deltaproteobacteria bacterium]